MGIFDVFKSKPDVREIGNLNCVNIGGKFDTGHKVDNKALFKFLKDHIKKNTLKKDPGRPQNAFKRGFITSLKLVCL